jgi:osmoprotectant transport system ATP-binding protein
VKGAAQCRTLQPVESRPLEAFRRRSELKVDFASRSKVHLYRAQPVTPVFLQEAVAAGSRVCMIDNRKTMEAAGIAEPVIEFCDVQYRLPNGTPLLSGLNLQINRGETLVLLGRSGSGKTTTLKLINRLLIPSGGEVRVNGSSTAAMDVIALRRSIGYVIQDVGLFPHFTVERNIALLPRIEGWPPEKIQSRIAELLQLVGLDAGLRSRYSHELSGGQRQRVGVARALAADPAILLMDEPFGALDAITRDELQREFLSLQQRLHKTVVFVTHDLREALRLGSRIALMESGRLTALLSPEEFLRSIDPRVAAYVEAFSGGCELLASRGVR